MHYSLGRARLIFNFSLHLDAVPPRNFPPSFLPSLGSISGYHVVHSPACQTLTMTSSVIHRENGYTFYTCHSLAHIPSPLSRTLRVNKDLHLADEVNADELCRRSLLVGVLEMSTYLWSSLRAASTDAENDSPYPAPRQVLNFYVIASEVATMRFLHYSGLPNPKIYGYSLSSQCWLMKETTLRRWSRCLWNS